ncbi:hypothetical protein DL93DRAFT_1095899 [Clavulina sp. PMI_390]|nr:hypothetical protein DL93DRAFT_1095899 [Clavulina sp. PMI_390]
MKRTNKPFRSNLHMKHRHPGSAPALACLASLHQSSPTFAGVTTSLSSLTITQATNFYDALSDAECRRTVTPILLSRLPPALCPLCPSNELRWNGPLSSRLKQPSSPSTFRADPSITCSESVLCFVIDAQGDAYRFFHKLGGR